MGATHVIGAGLAGLACAVKLLRAGRPVRLYEASARAGGRCRSFHDGAIDRVIDNGNHLMLSGNRALLAYLEDIGAAHTLSGPPRAEFPFLDLATGERWTVRPGAGPIPWWIVSRRRRVPGTRLGEYLQGFRLARARGATTVAQCLDTEGALYRRFWEPLSVAVLNAGAGEGAASLLWPVLRETFGRGETACRPLLPRHGLGPSFIEPAVAFLQRNGCPPGFGRRLRSMKFEDDRVAGLDFGGEEVPVAVGDLVVLALPAGAVPTVVPDVEAPGAHRAIVNAHLRLGNEFGEPSFLGLVGGIAQWLFLRGDVVSVTVSAADGLLDEPSRIIAERVWPDVARALGRVGEALPPYRIVKEKRATFAQIPAEVARRPACATRWRNLFLAGDWTDTGLPATMEGAVRSGGKAADFVLKVQ